MGDYPLAEHAFGAAFKNHVLLAVSSDTGVPFLVNGYEDKVCVLPNENQALAICGSPGDRVQFSDYVVRNVALSRFRTLQAQHLAAKAHWMRNVLASSIRSDSPFFTNVLLGGFDSATANTSNSRINPAAAAAGSSHNASLDVPSGTHGFADSILSPSVLATAEPSVGAETSLPPAQLWWLDCLGAMASVRYAGHGRLISFATAVFDRYYDENMTIEQSVELMKKAIETVRAHCGMVSLVHFTIKAVTRDGVVEIDVPAPPVPPAPTDADMAIPAPLPTAPAHA